MNVVQPEVIVGTPVFENAPEWLTPEIREGIARVAQLHGQCYGDFQSGAVRSVRCGLELLALKALAGHGRWGECLARWLSQAGISERTAQRYMHLAASARKALGNSRGHLAEAALAEALGTAVTPDDWREILEAFRLVREGGRGGFHPPLEFREAFARLMKLRSTDYADWPRDMQVEFRKWLKEEKRRRALAAAEADPGAVEARRRAAAERHWKPVLSAVKIGLHGHRATWLHLPREQRAELRELMLKFAETLEATL